jgi:uncharacterized membrane protein HdeD (DUF308 family)
MAYVANAPLGPRVLLHALARHWWLLLLRGICAILFGVLAFVWPGITLLTLVLLYGAFALVDGVLALAEAVMGGAPAPRWWLALVGLLGIAVGILTFAWPGITALVLLLFIAGWAIATGILQIVGAIRLRKEIDNEWLLIASGVVSIIFGDGRLGLTLRHRHLRDYLRHSRDLAFATSARTRNALEWRSVRLPCRIDTAPGEVIG